LLPRLDGLNKELDLWDSQFYMGEFRSLCSKEKMNELLWPMRDYVIQIARFDPSKGIPNVIDSYAKFRALLRKQGRIEEEKMPQLLVCGHGAVDDPDASIIYDEIMMLLATEQYAPYANDIVVMRLPPSDQLLNALMANSKIALQLSSREGFEVKVSEALHAGKPVVASRTGGDSVADPARQVWVPMSEYARTHVSDEVGTVGNAAAWLYLAVMYSRGVKVRPNGAWINDLMRKETGQPYMESEPRLPRGGLDVQG
ncbi:hypothetical protein EW146_g8790, partial [Bondarzewia mesenterica]